MDPQQESAGPEARRRSTRLTISIPVTMRGEDANGKAFSEKTHTILVNNHGAMLETSHPLTLGSTLSIENPAQRQSVQAKVVWLGDKPSSPNLLPVGVELTEPQNIWGIDFPPLDWGKPSPASLGAQKPAEVEPASKAPAREKTAAAELRPPVTVRAGAASAAAPQASPVPEEVIATLQLAATRFAKQIEEMTEARVKLLREQLAKLGGETREAVRTELEEMTAQCLELSKAELRKQTETQLELHIRQLEEMRRRAMDSALQAFRNRVAAALAGLEEASPGRPGKSDPDKP